MLDIGIFAPFGDDHERNIAFCRDSDVHHIVVSTGNIPCTEPNLPDPEALSQLAAQYRQHDIHLAALTPPRVPQTAFEDETVRDSELAYMERLLAAMGQAGITYVHFYLNVDPLDDEAKRNHLWEGLVEYYRRLVALAEAADVRISTHHFHVPDRLLWNYQTMSTLLDQAPSSHNGVTFCQGKSQMAGDDLPRDILRYGAQITMFHIRDVATRVEGAVAPEIEQRLADMGYLEVAFGAGEVDMLGSIKALKKIGYKGQIYPEHYPSIAGDSAAGLAWTIGYIRALDQSVEV
ncbi:MAG: TIM barrel protein [Candidatus Latescibacteria bacterium]|nr:TIM barrel protein [Candidatus Latescibacterota bacterium]